MTTITTITTHDWPAEVTLTNNFEYVTGDRADRGWSITHEFVPANSTRSYSISEDNYVTYTELPKDATGLRDTRCLNAASAPTFGHKAVGLGFNPSGDRKVAACKTLYANVIDQLNDFRSLSGSSEARRLASIAITEAQTAQMWAVKALTWKD